MSLGKWKSGDERSEAPATQLSLRLVTCPASKRQSLW
jgi:hypothetical protein